MTAEVLSILAGAAIGAAGAIWAGRAQARAGLAASVEQARSTERITRLQIEASLLAASRQQWMDQLRVELAHYVSELSRMRMFMQYTEPSEDEAKAQMPLLVRSYAQIELMLDREEPTHRALTDLLRQNIESVALGDDGEATRIVARILVSGNDVFARENERIRQIARQGADALDGTVPAARTVAA